MNLYVNLILESELRSSSRVSRKFAIMVSAVTFISILLSIIAFVMIGAHSAKRTLVFAEQEHKQLNPVFMAVNDLKQELAEIQNLTNAIATWSQTRVDYPGLFIGLQSVVPPNIQLIRLTINESIAMIENVPTRSITLYFQGKAAGDHSETDVQHLEKNMKEKPPFNEIMDLAEVKQFEAVKNNAGQTSMRAFDIECRLKTRKLFQPVKINPVKTK